MNLEPVPARRVLGGREGPATGVPGDHPVPADAKRVGVTGGIDAAPAIGAPSERHGSHGPSPSDVFGELCFEVGDALVQEPVVGPCRRESLLQLPTGRGQFPELLFELGVGRGEGLAVVGAGLGEVGELAHEVADAGAQGPDLAVGSAQLGR